jgi:formate hydrogenlyase transcriptional activator
MKNQKSDASFKDEKPERFSELDALIIKISTGFANAYIDQINGKMDQALKQVAECLDLDRCAFWEISADATKMSWTHQYVVAGLNKLSEEANEENFPWMFKKAKKGDFIYFTRLEDLPEEASTDKESFRAIGTKSLMMIPYYIAGRLIAGITFSVLSKERNFPANLITRLQLFGEIITGAFYRMVMEEKYRKCIIEAHRLDERLQPEDLSLLPETKNACSYEGIIGSSAAMKLVYSRIEQVAPTDSVVLLLGETGTGKGVAARAIHELSRRNKKRMVTVNCAALTPTLIESELFGREKGAYTGSVDMQIGRFELADKGTLVLDEIAELPLDLQAKLLRAIQDGEFERLGSPKTIKVDVRILALTSRDLKEEVSRGRFRRDLYYRLNVFPITMPNLSQRREDIPFLAEYFVAQFNRKMQKEITTIPNHVITELLKYTWPGNVRELEHIIERAVISTKGHSLRLAEKLDGSETGESEEHQITNLAEVEKRHIIRILEKVNWRIDGSKGAAVLLGLHPNTLRGRMQKLDIHLPKSDRRT